MNTNSLQEDSEANYFAMELLMPEDWLRADLGDKKVFDIESDPAIGILAARYQVSEQLMTLRLVQIGVLKP